MNYQDQRRHPRADVLTAIMISPNGHENWATVFNLSESGAMVGLPPDFRREIGAALRLFFQLDDDDTVILRARVARVAVDHLGLQFAPFQERDIRHLMAELSGTG